MKRRSTTGAVESDTNGGSAASAGSVEGTCVVDEGRPTNGEEYRNRLRRAVEDDFDAFVGHLYTAMVEQLPEYEASANDVDDVRAAVKHSARLVLAAMFGGTLHSSDQSIWRVIGAQRARGGLPREALAAAPAVAMHRGFDFVLGRSTTIPAPGPLATAVLHDLWARLVAATSTVTESLLAGYDEQRSLDLSESTRPQVALVDRLLSSLWDDRHEIVERGRRLGIDVACPHGALVLVSSRNVLSDLAAGAKALTGLVPEALDGPCRTAPRPHVVLLVPARPAGPWRSALLRAGAVATQHSLHIVVMDPVDPVDRLGATYRRTLRFFESVPVATSGPGTLTMFDLEYHWALGRAPVDERVDVVRTVLGPVLDTAKAEELLDLLDTLYETRAGLAGAARALGIHPNTVNKRKRRIHELAGLSLDVPADAHRLFTARLLHKALLASRGGLPGPQDSM